MDMTPFLKARDRRGRHRHPPDPFGEEMLSLYFKGFRPARVNVSVMSLSGAPCRLRWRWRSFWFGHIIQPNGLRPAVWAADGSHPSHPIRVPPRPVPHPSAPPSWLMDGAYDVAELLRRYRRVGTSLVRRSDGRQVSVAGARLCGAIRPAEGLVARLRALEACPPVRPPLWLPLSVADGAAAVACVGLPPSVGVVVTRSGAFPAEWTDEGVCLGFPGRSLAAPVRPLRPPGDVAALAKARRARREARGKGAGRVGKADGCEGPQEGRVTVQEAKMATMTTTQETETTTMTTTTTQETEMTTMTTTTVRETEMNDLLMGDDEIFDLNWSGGTVLFDKDGQTVKVCPDGKLYLRDNGVTRSISPRWLAGLVSPAPKTGRLCGRVVNALLAARTPGMFRQIVEDNAGDGGVIVTFYDPAGDEVTLSAARRGFEVRRDATGRGYGVRRDVVSAMDADRLIESYERGRP